MELASLLCGDEIPLDVCVCVHVQLDLDGLYEREGSAPVQHLQSALTDEKKKAGAHASGDSLAGVVWTPSMRRMFTLLDRCVRLPRPTPPTPTVEIPLI